MTRRGFTLMEMLISLMIFSVVSIGMVLVLRSGVELFRLGERGRQSADEAAAATAALADDLANMLTASEGGFFYARSADWGAGKPNAVSWKIRNGDPTAIAYDGQDSRLLVVWWQDAQDRLHRSTFASADANPRALAPGTGPTPTSDLLMVKAIYSAAAATTPDPTIIAEGCLQLGVDVENAAAQRDFPGWTKGGAPLPPAMGADYKTTGNGGLPADPFPLSVRLTLVMGGDSRHRLEGAYIGIDGNGRFRVSGVRTVPLIGGLARIGDPAQPAVHPVEWVAYDSFPGGALAHDGGAPTRGCLKTDGTAGHDRGAPVLFGSPVVLTRVLR